MRIILSFFLLACFHFTYAQCLSGTYTIGGSSADFTTINKAVDALDSNGICGNVYFNIKGGTYNEQISIPTIAGTKPNRRIFFQSEIQDSTSVIIQWNSGSNNNYIFHVASPYITLRHLTLRALNLRYSRLLTYEYADSLHLESCILDGIDASSNMYLYDQYLMTVIRGFNNNIEIRNCIFNKGSIGLIAGNNYPGTAYLDRSPGWIIENNIFNSQENNALQLKCLRSFSVRDNKFISTDSIRTYGRVAIDAVRDCREGSISRNDIRNYAGSGFQGEVQNTIIRNNMISLKNYFSNNVYLIGISFSDYENKVLNNTVVILPSLNKYSVVLYLNTNNSRGYLKNNIFLNLDTSRVVRSINGVYAGSFDNNIYYTLDTNFALMGKYSQNYVYMSSLSQWQTQMKVDSNSNFHFPSFYGLDDLHLTNDSILIGQGEVLSNVLDDFDRELRGQTNDIGADQYSPFQSDLGCIALDTIKYACDSISLSLILKNYGVDTIKSFGFKIKNHLGVIESMRYQTLISPNSISNILLGGESIEEDQQYSFSVWIDTVNGRKDQNRYNDTINSTFKSPLKSDSINYIKQCNGDTSILTLNNYYSSYSWSNGSKDSIAKITDSSWVSVKAINNYGCKVDDSSLITFLPKPHKPTITKNGIYLLSSNSFGNQWYYNGSVLVGDTFQILMTTSYGYYSVQTVNQFGCFTHSDSIAIGITTLSDIASNNTLLSYPNPVLNKLHLESGHNIISYKLFDIYGSLLARGRVNERSVDIDCSEFSSGFYVVEIKTVAGLIKKQIQKIR
jgi:hypothetical protein